MLSDSERGKGFARAARHDEFTTIRRFETVENVIKRRFLMFS